MHKSNFKYDHMLKSLAYLTCLDCTIERGRKPTNFKRRICIMAKVNKHKKKLLAQAR